MSSQPGTADAIERLAAVVTIAVLLFSTASPLVLGATSPERAGDAQTSVPEALETNATVDNDDRVLITTHARIEYHEGYHEEAANVAAVVDEHYRVIYQKFSVPPGDDRIDVYVGPRETFRCEGRGCIGPLGTVYISDDDRSLLHHELVHTLQLRTHWGVAEWLTPPAPAEGAIVEGTARYLDSPAASIEQGARFDPETIELTSHPETSAEYDDRALFAEFVLDEYGRAAFDSLYVEGDVEGLENATDERYEEVVRTFYDSLDEQQSRLRSGGTTFPAFTYEPFVVTPGETVTVDARTPDAIEALDRDWYPTSARYAWDLTGDGFVDVTGPDAVREFPAEGAYEVTLFVTVDGQTLRATQTVHVSEARE